MSTKDWLEKDYYKVLGVSKDARPEDIKKAFRKLARENHPDQNQGDKSAEKRFKEISEANTILSDPAKRKEYDQQRSLFGGGGFRFPGAGGATGGGSTNVNDLFRHATATGDSNLGDIFGNLFGTGPAPRRNTRSPRRGSDVEGEVTIDFTDAISGATVGVQMISEQACEACRGTGAKAGTMPRVCPTCQGSGMQASQAGGVFSVTEPCKDCRGRGMIVDDPCEVCNGSGRGRSSRTMQVRIPAGVSDKQRIRIKGKGGPGENGGAAGDLYVVVHVRPHKIFGRSGDNLTINVPVTFAEASLGATIEVPTLNGAPVKLKLAAGTPNGRTLRVRGKGSTKADGTKGDLLVTVEVEVPDHLSDEARKALDDYAKAVGESNPRAGLFGG
ncbi:molecular chaperone DnaJ [Propionibacteriaceae bacterium G57]|uniref:molecular chaperone DnaJ n=1 Tax=Aestuariimicrobium sp. G57 TaxID=3418485 RepID=UPI003DA6F8E8